LAVAVALSIVAGYQTGKPAQELSSYSHHSKEKSEKLCLPRLSDPSCFYKQDPTGKRTKLIIFVHGIFGSAVSSWGNSANEAFWPAMVAADGRFIDYDLYLLNYRAPYFKNAPNIHETAEIELSNLKDRGGFNQYTDLHFVGHSMGGLVIKSMMVRLDAEKLSQVKSITFLATPSQGAAIATSGSWVSMNPQIRDMERAHLNTFIQSLEDKWVRLMISRDHVRARFPRVHCAYETLPTNGVFIVPREMASTRCDAPIHPLAFDHSEIATPTRQDADPYLWVMTRILDATAEDEGRKKAARLLAQAERLKLSGDPEEAWVLLTEA
jgi:hypothetical protein